LSTSHLLHVAHLQVQSSLVAVGCILKEGVHKGDVQSCCDLVSMNVLRPLRPLRLLQIEEHTSELQSH